MRNLLSRPQGRALLVGVLATVMLELLLNGIEHLGGEHATLEIRRAIWSLVLGTVVGGVLFAMHRVKTLEKDDSGVAKRVVAEEKLEKLAKNRTDISVGIVDVNGLKKINDQFGHAAGDELIAEVALRLRVLSLRDPELMVARMGGDEFIVIAPGCTVPDLVAMVSATLDQVHRFGSFSIASCGVARTRTGSRDVLRCADMAMYRAKQGFYARMALGEAGVSAADVVSYDVVLDGAPVLDGTRPNVRLRGA